MWTPKRRASAREIEALGHLIAGAISEAALVFAQPPTIASDTAKYAEGRWAKNAGAVLQSAVLTTILVRLNSNGPPIFWENRTI